MAPIVGFQADGLASRLTRYGPLALVIAVAAVLRFWNLTAVGFNSDEAVYAGTAASIAGNDELSDMFPIFRAHPVLFQALVSLGMFGDIGDWLPRAFAASVGIGTVVVTYHLGERLYGRTAGLIGGLILAVMPYHVVVSRQVLLDGLMTAFATLALYCVMRYAMNGAPLWLVAAGASFGLAMLSKETSVILIGGLYAFFALTPNVAVRLRHLLTAAGAAVAVALPIPIAMAWLRQGGTGQNYLLWQLFRRPNHDAWFYWTVLPNAMGVVVLAAAIVGTVWLRRAGSWPERLLVCWIAAPLIFFNLWSVKGYQYLLPIAPAVAILAGRCLSALAAFVRRYIRGRSAWYSTAVTAVAASIAVVSLIGPTWRAVNPSPTSTFLAGSGGLPGGREAGLWVRDNVPKGARLLAIGPSMANVLEFYGRRRVLALSVSTNPAERNPAYVAVANPDRALRDAQFQYIVWDAYTADRARFFADKAQELINRFHGVAVYTGTVTVAAPSGESTIESVIIIYKVRSI